MNRYIELLVPDVGGDSVEVISLMFSKGDSIKSEQSIMVVETDKASMEIPCLVNGVIEEIIVSKGDVLNEGDRFALVCVSINNFQNDYASVESINILPEAASNTRETEELLDRFKNLVKN